MRLPARRIAAVLACFLVTFVVASCARPEVAAPSIPAHFTTDTEESGLFSISYPSDWETPTHLVEPMKEAVAAYLRDIGSTGLAESVEHTNMVFVAGAGSGAGYNPNVNVIVVATNDTRGNLNQLVDDSIEEINKSAGDVRVLQQFDTTVGGCDAVVVEYEGTMLNLAGEGEFLLMVLRGNRSMWFVTCTVLPPLEIGDLEEELLAILRSVRLGDAA